MSDDYKKALLNRAKPKNADEYIDSAQGFAGDVIGKGLELMAPIGRTIDRFTGAPTRAAVAELMAGKGLSGATPAFMGQFGEDPELAPTGKELAQKMGAPETTLSEKLPGLYSDTGHEWTKLKKGGLLDPTASGAAGVGLDMALDPINLVTMGGGIAGKALSKFDEANDLLKFKNVAKDAEIAGDVAKAPGEMIDMAEALKRRNATKDLSVVDEAIAAPKPRSLSENYNIVDHTEKLLKNRNLNEGEIEALKNFRSSNQLDPELNSFLDKTISEQEKVLSTAKPNTVTELPKEKLRDPKVDPIPPGVDPEEFQAFRESPYADNQHAFLDAKNDVSRMQDEAQKAVYAEERKGKSLDNYSKVKKAAEQRHEDYRNKVVKGPGYGDKELAFKNKNGMTEPEFKQLHEAMDANGLSEVQQKILARYGGEPQKTQKHVLELMKKPHDQPYIGIKDSHGSLYATENKLGVSNTGYWGSAMPLPANTSIERLPTVMGKKVLGTQVPQANMDPFIWADRKYGASKKLLEDSLQSNTPMRINTRSDLIATQEYMDLLDPKLHDVNLFMGPLDDDINRITNPGAPSIERLKEAANALHESNITPTIHVDTFPNAPNQAFRNTQQYGIMKLKKEMPGIKIVENPITLDKHQLKQMSDALGWEGGHSGLPFKGKE